MLVGLTDRLLQLPRLEFPCVQGISPVPLSSFPSSAEALYLLIIPISYAVIIIFFLKIVYNNINLNN